MATRDAPLEIGRVALTVNDLPAVRDYYRAVLGLTLLNEDGETAVLGAGERPLLELRGDRAARRRSPREAGLFHTAFLLPGRADLGAWIGHAAERRFPVGGAADHGVSEALYLSDPEGNGIEIYADRPRDTWVHRDGEIIMGTDPLDIDSILRDAAGPWAGAPEGTVIGHVHLQTGTLAEAADFYAGKLGFDLTHRYPGAYFYGAGGYHHHLATNVWNSRNAAPRNYPSTGLAELEIIADPEARAALLARTGGAELLRDPWNTAVRISERAA